MTQGQFLSGVKQVLIQSFVGVFYSLNRLDRIYKEDLALNNQQGLIYHKSNQTKVWL